MNELNKGDILIVDDKGDNLRVLSSLLTERGYKTRAVLNGMAALKAARSTLPDLILLDVLMPEMNGYQVCQLFKQEEKLCDVPVIFLSALDEMLDKVTAFQVGAVDYITKPFQIEEILIRVETHLKLRFAQASVHQLNLELEARVRQRTELLEVTNQQLLNEIQERRRAEEQLRFMALHDGLTQLPNRAFFMQRMQELLEQMPQAADRQFALLFLDCDGFKVVNDSLGHLVGDQLLVAIARRLESALESDELLIRLGGDEFLVLLETIRSAKTATQLASRILNAYAAPFLVEQHLLYISVSIGIVVGGADYNKPEDVLRNADIAMYQAKAKGKAAYQVFSSDMYAQALSRMQLENALRSAIERQELLLHYQPIISLETLQLSGFEALLRWNHSQWGLINPAEFIGLAEETGLIVSIGQWVLETAAQQLQAWSAQLPQAASLTMSVNLSSKQLNDPQFIHQIEQILQQTGIGNRLMLELTESTMMWNIQEAMRLLQRLKDQSVQIGIDDFGQGYSSLSYLHDLPVDVIKIDRAFVSGSGNVAASSSISRPEIVRTIIDLAQNLEVKVVAEGIETAAQFSQLRQLDCTWGQGFFFSKPVDREAAFALIATNKSYDYSDSA